ncbi:MAG: hypothetical protein V1855_03765, partial [bacterium]
LTSSEYYSTFVFADDFSYWGKISKIIAVNDRLIVANDAIGIKDYPPGMALFDYLFFQFAEFSESLALFSHGIFIIAAFSQLFSAIPKVGSRYVFFGVSFFICSLIYFFELGLHTLSVDLIVGVVFGISLFGYLVESRQGKTSSIIRLIPLVMVLPLIKSTGILFAFVIIAVVLCDLLIGSINGREKIKLILIALLLIPSCILAYASWNTHVKNMGFEKTFNTRISFGEVVNAFSSESVTERQKETIDNFKRRVLLPHPESKYLPSRQYYWLTVCIAFVWLIWCIRRDDKSKSWEGLVPFAVLFGGFCAYLFVLLVLYMFSFGAYEGPRLASFARYVNTYLVGVLIILFGMSLSQYFRKKQDRAVTIFLITICFFIMLPNLKAGLLDMYHVIRGGQNRDIENVAKYWKVIENKTPPTSKIYFLWQGSNGTEMQIFSYGIMHRENNHGCWSVGEPYDDGDVWTCRMTSSEFEQALMDYDYLFVGHADKKFESSFSPLFGSDDVQDGSLFQILKGDGHIRLSKI